MRSALAASILVLALAGAAQAACPSVPDTRETHDIDNMTSRTLCQQRELSDSAERLGEQGRILSDFNARMTMFRLEQQLRAQPQPGMPPL